MTIEASNVFSDGFVRIHRQRTDKPFIPQKILVFETSFNSLSLLHEAFSRTVKREAETAKEMPFAWNPEFGYITARPDICGTGLQISGLFHLEALNLVGQLDHVLNALNGLRMDAIGIDGDAVIDAGHFYRVSNASMLGTDEKDIESRTGRIFSALVQQEINARIRLIEELPRVFDDALCRSIALLKSCKLISEWEFLDLISPLKIAAELGYLDNFTKEMANSLIRPRLDLPEFSNPSTIEEIKEKDMKEASFANKVNKMFKSVRLNARGKEFLR
jgi:protein-arginine kinase